MKASEPSNAWRSIMHGAGVLLWCMLLIGSHVHDATLKLSRHDSLPASMLVRWKAQSDSPARLTQPRASICLALAPMPPEGCFWLTLAVVFFSCRRARARKHMPQTDAHSCRNLSGAGSIHDVNLPLELLCSGKRSRPFSGTVHGCCT